jgi:hypothetical protein
MLFQLKDMLIHLGNSRKMNCEKGFRVFPFLINSKEFIANGVICKVYERREECRAWIEPNLT